MRHKLAIISTHPIQYYAPMFQMLARHCDLKVYYTWGMAGLGEKFDPDFKKSIVWDIPLLSGYEYEFLENVAKKPGSHHFSGIDNPKLIESVLLFQPNAILIYGWSYKSHLKAIRYFSGKVPLWFRGDSNLLDKKPLLKTIVRSLFLKWVYSHIDKAFYVGSANKAYYKSFGLSEDQLIFAPHAIDNERFSVAHPKEVSELRKSLGIETQETLILFAGKLEEKKDPGILLSAFKDLKKSDLHLLYVGNGDLMPVLVSKVKDANLKNVHFIDFQNQSQMPIVYQACDLFCLPSRGPGETWGLAVNEAMAAGKAIVVSDKVGCSKDLVNDEENGFIFESENLKDLIYKISTLTKGKLGEMGKTSIEIIKKWSFDEQTRIIINELNNESN